LTAPAYTKFDPRALLENERREVSPANVAKVAKVPHDRKREQTAPLAGLAALAGGPAETENLAPALGPWIDAEEERAAIVEYDGGAPRPWAEATARLDANRPPGDVPPERWLRFIDDCGRFLDSGWSARAAVLGWGPLDLFGCDRERPFVRREHKGLLWLLNGGTIVELHRDRAIIEVASGARQSYLRRPTEVGRVALPWELTR